MQTTKNKLIRPTFLFILISLPLAIGFTIGGLFMGYYIEEFTLILNPLVPLGVVAFIIALIGAFMILSERKKVAGLKEHGEKFDADALSINAIQSITGHRYINWNYGGVTSTIDCAYTNASGEKCLVRSKLFIFRAWDSTENIQAQVYVDKNDPRRYYVEAFRTSPGIKMIGEYNDYR